MEDLGTVAARIVAKLSKDLEHPMRHITAAEVMDGIIEPMPPIDPIAVKDRVFNKADPRHVGRVHSVFRGVALVQWHWNGPFEQLGVEELRRVP
jgi:hypothetical protein